MSDVREMSSEAFLAALRGLCASEGLPLSGEVERLAARHAELLLRANSRTNLTRITSPEEMARRHFLESFLAAQLWGPSPPDRPLRVLDVGSGGGFPGLAGRIVRPDVELTCLEPRAAKAAHLSRVAAGLPPPTPRVRSLRLEALHVEHGFDVVTFRALALPAAAIQQACTPGGRVVGFPGGDEAWSSELQAAGWQPIERRRLAEVEREVVAWARSH